MLVASVEIAPFRRPQCQSKKQQVKMVTVQGVVFKIQAPERLVDRDTLIANPLDNR